VTRAFLKAILRTLWAQLGQPAILDACFANLMGATWPKFYFLSHFSSLFCEPNGRNLVTRPLLKPIMRTKWAQLGDQTTSQAHYANQMGVTWPIGHFRGLFCEPNGRNLENSLLLKPVLRTRWA
jgi:hypothetical protein